MAKTKEQTKAAIKSDLDSRTVSPAVIVASRKPDLSSMIFQGWVSVAVWMAMGLLFEGLIGFKTPAYLQDEQRRELLRLAHAHGTLLGLLLVLAAVCCQRFALSLPAAAVIALRVGAIVMPIGFLIGGLWHFESDPGVGIWLVPPGALLVIFGVVGIALASRKSQG